MTDFTLIKNCHNDPRRGWIITRVFLKQSLFFSVGSFINIICIESKFILVSFLFRGRFLFGKGFITSVYLKKGTWWAIPYLIHNILKCLCSLSICNFEDK